MVMEMSSKAIVGIDYSTSSPCICIKVGDEYDFHYLTKVKKLAEYSESEKCSFTGTLLPKTKDFLSKTHQYAYIMNWAIEVLDKYDVGHVWLEDYAFGATGKVFHIGENTGLLKHKLTRKEIPFTVVPPTVIKKEMIGKGNAKKEEIVEKFINETWANLHLLLDTTTMNPASDIADSYFICRYGLQS